ncbi:MAG: WD40 repeat domain-containing protein [Planctomycetaceae bacterium]|jgi:WD40 repeat protein|nr:WD40 repeat domain-containing protein [Planctomycetaceae bacterium]
MNKFFTISGVSILMLFFAAICIAEDNALLTIPIRDISDVLTTDNISSDEKYVVAVNNRAACVWEIATGKELHQLGGDACVMTVLFSPDGKKLITANFDGTARIYDTVTGKELLILKGHKRVLFSAVFSPDGKLALTTSGSEEDCSARIWDAKTGEKLHVLQIVTEQNKFSLMYGAFFSHDGKLVLTRSFGKPSMTIWDTQTGAKLQEPIGRIGLLARIDSPAIFFEGKLLLRDTSTNVRVWDTILEKEINVFDVQLTGPGSVLFSPDGKLIAVTDYKTPAIIDSKTGKTLKKLEGHTEMVLSAAEFSPDGKLILTSSYDCTARIWDAATGKELKKIEGHTKALNSANFSKSGNLIMTRSWDNTAKIWEVSKLLKNKEQSL